MIKKTLIILSLAGSTLSLALWLTSVSHPARCELIDTNRILLAATADQGRLSTYFAWAHATEVGRQEFLALKALDRWMWEDRGSFAGLVYDSAVPSLPQWYLGTTDCSLSVMFPLWVPAVVLSLYPALALPGMLRRRYRRNKGLCLKCGYNLRALPQPRCPECGTEFSQRTPEPNLPR